MKDEIADLIDACETYEQVTAQIDDWMDFYNNDRSQWNLLKLAPREYYEYLQTGIYPLPVFEKETSRALPRTPRFNALGIKRKSDSSVPPSRGSALRSLLSAAVSSVRAGRVYHRLSGFNPH